MGNHKIRCSDEQQHNRERLVAELKTASRLGKRVNVSTLEMHALLVERDALGQYVDEPRRRKSPEDAAQGFSVPDGVDAITTREFLEAQGWHETRASLMRAGEILRGLGFRKERRMENGVRRWVFFRI